MPKLSRFLLSSSFIAHQDVVRVSFYRLSGLKIGNHNKIINGLKVVVYIAEDYSHSYNVERLVIITALG